MARSRPPVTVSTSTRRLSIIPAYCICATTNDGGCRGVCTVRLGAYIPDVTLANWLLQHLMLRPPLSLPPFILSQIVPSGLQYTTTVKLKSSEHKDCFICKVFSRQNVMICMFVAEVQTTFSQITVNVTATLTMRLKSW